MERLVAMEVSVENARLAKVWLNERELRRKFGMDRAKILVVRRQDLNDAETLADMRYMPGRCHELTGDLAGHLALDLDGPYRLLFRPAEDTAPGPGGGLDWSAVRSVVVVDIIDYH